MNKKDTASFFRGKCTHKHASVWTVGFSFIFYSVPAAVTNLMYCNRGQHLTSAAF